MVDTNPTMSRNSDLGPLLASVCCEEFALDWRWLQRTAVFRGLRQKVLLDSLEITTVL